LKSSARRYLEFIALCLLAAAIVWWFGRKLNWAEVREGLGKANWSLLAAAAIVISTTYLSRAYRWGAFLRPLGPAKLKDLFIATTVGFGVQFLVGRLGEVVRPVVLPMRDPRVRPSASFVTILIERIYDVIAVVVLFAISLLWFKPTASLANEFGRVRMVGAGLLLACIFGVFFLAWFRRRSAVFIGYLSGILNAWHFVPTRLTRGVVSLLEQLASALRVLVDARELLVTMGWTAAVWIVVVVANLLVFRAFGLPFGLTATLFVLGWSLVGSLVPTPGGAAGAFHAATAAGLIFLGVARDTAAGVAIILHLVDFGPAVIIGLFFVIRGDVSISRLRSLTTPEAVEHAVEDEEIAPGEPLLETAGVSDRF
jgi:uncharacterized protein (TIRG00374 family)